MRERIRKSGIVNIDETGIKVDGKSIGQGLLSPRPMRFMLFVKVGVKSVGGGVGASFLGLWVVMGGDRILRCLKRFSVVGLFVA
ncbi:MAG: hypothetical protein LBC12_04995 [Nitrososphaerota archaeon]|jgi:hypothetical protein|nr:hypothetical protein [Nitrososphaerota archaeon]